MHITALGNAHAHEYCEVFPGSSISIFSHQQTSLLIIFKKMLLSQ